MRQKLISTIKVFSLGLIASCGFLVGSCFQKSSNADLAPYQNLEMFSRVLQYITNNYVEEVDVASLISGAIKGMISTLDPHSSFLEPKIFKEFKEETSGKFGGLGIEISITKKNLVVVAPIEDSPAYNAGVKSGDIIVAIDKTLTKDLSIAEAATLMKGDPGTEVTLTIKREGEDKYLSLKIKREFIKSQSVRSTLYHDDTAYFRISSFQEKTSNQLEKALKEKLATKTVQGIILDLRGNPGGLLDQAVRVANFFVEEGPIVYTIGRDKSKKDISFAQQGQKITDLPMVVLVDGSSASASEIVSGALKDHGRAVIAGQRTFGKGSVQTIIPMGDSYGLKITVARYYTPSGTSIQATGIEPDVHIDYIDRKTLGQIKRVNRRLREKDLSGHFENEAVNDDSTNEGEEEDSLASTLSERLDEDYMISQARGILKTMKLVSVGSKKPEFNIDEGESLSGDTDKDTGQTL